MSASIRVASHPTATNAVLRAVAAAFVVWVGPPGTDFPAHLFQLHLYRAQLTPGGYLAWLRALAARYVVLTDSSPDYSSLREAELLENGRSGLRIMNRTPHATIYAVPSPRALVAGPGHVRVLSFIGSTVRLAIQRAGRVPPRHPLLALSHRLTGLPRSGP